MEITPTTAKLYMMKRNEIQSNVASAASSISKITSLNTAKHHTIFSGQEWEGEGGGGGNYPPMKPSSKVDEKSMYPTKIFMQLYFKK
jgi:hypothetical protein